MKLSTPHAQIPELSLKERYQLCLAPANITRDIMRDWLLFFATQYAAGTTVFHPTFDMKQLEPLGKLDKLFHLEQYNTVRAARPAQTPRISRQSKVMFTVAILI